MRTLLQLMMFFVFVMHQAASAQNDCGNTSFSGSKGVVTSPNFPLPYPHNLSCTYSIDVGRNNSIQLKFLDFDLELPNYAENCTRDWLMITCNETDDENLDFSKRYCGTTVPRTSLRFFNCPVVELKFFADSSVGSGGFSIEYKVLENSTSADSITDLVCGETLFTSASGFIRLPSNPTDYSASVNCTYTISTDNASTFSLGVLFFQIPQLLDSFADCSREYIMVGCISDGETELNPKTSNTYCRRSFDDIPVQPSRIVFSNCSMIGISIRSYDYNYQGANNIPFRVSAYDEDCGSTFFTGPTGIVTSPRFPLSHPHSLNCVYFIDVDRTETVTLHFLSFNLEGTSQSPYDTDYCYDTKSWLTVSCLLDDDYALGNPNQNRKYCGEKLKPLLLNFSNCDSLAVNFVIANTSVSTRGFQLQYTITAPGNTTPSTPDRANTSFTGPTGFITSPRFPLSYPRNLDYVYSIDVNRTNMVGLYFYSFSLEGKWEFSYMDFCLYDWLLIRCISEWELYHYNRKYCGVKTIPLILSYYNCDSLTLNFVSDFSVTSGGFKIWYTITTPGQSSCGNTSYSGPNGIVTSPNFPITYRGNMSCTYSIDVGRNSSVQLEFEHFELEAPNSAGYCENDWLMITCNGTAKANPNSNKKFCGAIKWTSSLRFVDCSSLVLEFVSDSSISSPGFMIEYTITENSNSTDDNSELDCGATLFTDSSGNISLPRNPTNYLATVNCTYTISRNDTSVIWLSTFLYSSLFQSFQDCDSENLMVGCVSDVEAELNPNTTRVICRGVASHSQLIFADCRALKLTVRSNTYDYRETFPIPYSAVGPNEVCGNTSFSALTGIVSTPRLPFQYPKQVNCLYTIDIGHVNSLVLSIDINLENWYGWYNPCGSGWLQITCLVNGTSRAHPIAGKLCGRRNLIKSRLPECQMVLLNFTSRYISVDRGFSLQYRMGDYQLDCGSTLFTNSTGVINLPRNPTNLLATVNCTYTISANHLRYIRLDANPDDSKQLLESFQDCSKEWLMVGCVSEGETELNPRTTRVFCGWKDPSYYYSPRLVFTVCQTLKLSVRSNTYDYRQTFRIPFTAVGPNEICGTTSFSAPTGVVSSPQLPVQYSSHVNCLYTIDSGQVNSVVLSLDRSTIGIWHYGCNSSWLTITCMVNGTSMTHPLADKKLCGNIHPEAARFPACQRVLLNFSSDYIPSHTVFTIRYSMEDKELDCGATLFNNSFGVIKLPRNPTNYPATVNCTYTISANDISHIWLKVYFYSHMDFFKSFQDCDRESLTIGCVSDGGTELNPNTTKVFCGREKYPSRLPDNLLFIDCRTLKLSIRSETYDLREMFSIHFTAVGPNEICGNTSFSTPTGVVSTPQLPFLYSKRVNCLYTIDSGNVNSVALIVKIVNLGRGYYPNGDCNSGSLTITCLVNGTSVPHPLAERKLCGYRQNPIIGRFPACQSVLLNFSKDYIYSSMENTIRYRIGDNELDCGATLFTNSFGVINLPRNPTNDLATVNCTYTISANDMSDIWLNAHFGSLLQSFQDCDRESLTIGCVSEGETELNPNTTKVFCRQERPWYDRTPLVFTDCRTLKLSIHSNTYDLREMFRIPFSVFGNEICGNTSLSAPTGIVSSPRLPSRYPKRINCLYVIDSGHVNSVVLSVDHLNLGSCNSGWLKITCLVNGTSMAHPLGDRKLCGSHHPIVARFPACRSVLLNFSSDYTLSDTGFTIRYRIGDYDPECGNTSFSGPNGFITSPRFPLSYAHNLNCLYSITGGRRNSISLSFLLFRLDGRSYTPSMDSCYNDWLTVSCLSDESFVVNISSSRKYCGIKTTPLTFSFPSCTVVVLNFQSNSDTNEGGFNVRYTVTDLDILCGARAYVRPSGMISFPWNYTDYDGILDCNYIINAMEPSSISLTIWSISLQSSVGRNCQHDRLLLTCIDGQTPLNLNISHMTCGHLNSSTQLTFPECTAIQVGFHRDSEATGKTFRIEYTVTSNADNVLTSELPTTSISATEEPVGTDKSCTTGCKLTADSTKCDCLQDTSQAPEMSISTGIPVTGSGKCEVGCKKSADGTTCDCSTTHSGDLIVNTQMNLSGKRGHAVGISLTVILLVAGAICLGAFLLFRRHRKKSRSEMPQQASEEETHQLELEADSTKAGSLFGAHRNQDRDTTKYLPLRPMSVSDHESGSNATEIHNEIQPGL